VGWTDQRDTKVRNLANGYIFCQQVENEPAGLRELALKVAGVSPSDFRGVDIGYNERNDELFIIEVNSAPGITGTNIRKYVEGITQNV
jgi:D-alanine-D-alanine ligase-like ATP-grasp enzyme